MKTSVICVNYRGSSDTYVCIQSLLKSNVEVEIIVVDNTPDDCELDSIVKDIPHLILLRPERNLGFGGANNLGIQWVLKNSLSEFILLLNNDAAIRPDTIELMEIALEKHPKVALVTPRIVYMDDPHQLWYGGGEMDWKRASAVAPGFNQEASAPLAMTERDVTFASGCAMLLRTTDLRQLGGFDQRFFMYEEDVELCLRISKAGRRIHYLPEALVLHRVQGSSRSKEESRDNFWSTENPNLPFYAYHVMRNRLLVIYLHARGWNLMKVVLFFPVFVLRRCFYFLLGRRMDAVLAMARGVVDFWGSKRLQTKSLMSE